MPHLRQMRLTRLSQLMVALVLVSGSLAGFALGQALAHDSSAAALPLQDQRASVTARTGPSSSTSATSIAASGGHSGGGS